MKVEGTIPWNYIFRDQLHQLFVKSLGVTPASGFANLVIDIYY